ncbi:hypothetical protein [Paenibacillus sp. FJAT-26967]|uniref:hypothetical protein n=1 Tax=Paenibacillus sp. FJAT-26967 TaxID=1729690 RepID=UPI000837BBC9|nr:hypothetical protein [Paenibacillus sp. FJAT-26967]
MKIWGREMIIEASAVEIAGKLFDTGGSMITIKEPLLHLIKDVINEINLESTDVTWSKYECTEELLNELRTYMDKILTNDDSVLQELKLCFAPTSSLQEISIENGWEDKFLEYAKRFEIIVIAGPRGL